MRVNPIVIPWNSLLLTIENHHFPSGEITIFPMIFPSIGDRCRWNPWNQEPDFPGLLGPFEAEVPETNLKSRNGSTYPTKKNEKKHTQQIFDYSSKPNVYIYKLYMGLSENRVNLPNEIAIFHRDNDQQNHWVQWGTNDIFRHTHIPHTSINYIYIHSIYSIYPQKDLGTDGDSYAGPPIAPWRRHADAGGRFFWFLMTWVFPVIHVTRPGKHTKNYGKSPCY